MRRASNHYGIIINDDKFIGFALGYDYCAEHEWGIKDLRRLCGIPESSKQNMGVKSRTITVCPSLVYKELKDKKINYAYLYTGQMYNTQEENEKYIPRDLSDFKETFKWRKKWMDEHPDKTRKDRDETIITAWDGGSFGIAVMGDKEVGYLRELHEAILNKNLTIAVTNLRAMNPFAGTSLCLLITDRIPQETLDAMYIADKEHYDREDYEEKIGMKDIIKKHGNKKGYKGDKYFMACSPKWIDYENAENREERKKKNNTKFDIMYWVNYSDDDDNCGWYTVEEIREWMTTKKKLVEIRKK